MIMLNITFAIIAGCLAFFTRRQGDKWLTLGFITFATIQVALAIKKGFPLLG